MWLKPPVGDDMPQCSQQWRERAHSVRLGTQRRIRHVEQFRDVNYKCAPHHKQRVVWRQGTAKSGVCVSCTACVTQYNNCKCAEFNYASLDTSEIVSQTVGVDNQSFEL